MSILFYFSSFGSIASDSDYFPLGLVCMVERRLIFEKSPSIDMARVSARNEN